MCLVVGERCLRYSLATCRMRTVQDADDGVMCVL
nr:MAG TPA: hypothetical protein [Caudoviricetes sp.]